MGEQLSKEEILKHLVQAAAEILDQSEIERIRSALQKFAESIWSVEHFVLEPEEQPANSMTIAKQAVSMTKKDED